MISRCPSCEPLKTGASAATPRTLWLFGVFAAVAMTTLAGCEVIGFLGQSLFNPKVEALYVLTDRPTLILVDDPTHQMGEPRIAYAVAEETGFHLAEASVVSESNLLAPARVHELAARLGSDYPQTPIDQIGRALGAQQVIHVYIHSVSLSPEPGLLRPIVEAHVKVIDVEQGRRVFPPPPQADQPLPRSHHPVTVTMFYRSAPNGGAEVMRAIQLKLVKRLGRDIARLFFDHVPRQPGDKFEQ